MPAQYAALPNPRNAPDDVEDEMEAAFDGSDDEEAPFVDARDRRSNSLDDEHPLNRITAQSQSQQPHSRSQSRTQPPGTYDFENVEYDLPPPGSPPRRDRALQDNDWGNSNGFIPTVPVAANYRARLNGASGGWLGRTARAILPRRIASRITGDGASSTRATVGGGLGNDGVFANVTAKPTITRPVEEGSSLYISINRFSSIN